MRTALLAVTAALLVAPPAVAAASPGGASAPGTDTPSGGVAYGAPVARATSVRPVATRFSVAPKRVVAGAGLPRLVLRIDEPGVAAVSARVVLLPLGRSGRIVRLDLGRVATGRVLKPSWPKGSVLAAGRYLVRVHAKDALGRTLVRRAQTSGRAVLQVVAAPAAPARAPVVATPVAPPATGAPATTPVALSPAPAPSGAGTFPVRGPWRFGDLFGAGRAKWSHQGVDVQAAEGTPVVAPVAGTIAFTDYQAAGAGYYIVQHTGDGRAFFYAHCQKGSVAVVAGQAVVQGAPLCAVGSTGDATGPHLHFELWPTGWRDVKGAQPADPLALLRSWAQLG